MVVDIGGDRGRLPFTSEGNEMERGNNASPIRTMNYTEAGEELPEKILLSHRIEE